MKRLKIDFKYIKRVLTLIIVMSCFTILFGLLIQIKRLMTGDKLEFSEILAIINYSSQIPYILIVSIVYGFFSGNPEDEKVE